MTDKQIERIKKLGLSVEDFQPKDKDERLDEIEAAIIELAEIIVGGED